MDTLFRNPSMEGVLPQFPHNQPLQNIYSNAEINRRVILYLQYALGGRRDTLSSDTNDLVVLGKHSTVLATIQQLATGIEQLFNMLPGIVKNIRKNTHLYTPYATQEHMKSVANANIHGKIELMQTVLDNINYNPDFASENSITKYPPKVFEQRQQQWAKKVGLKLE